MRNKNGKFWSILGLLLCFSVHLMAQGRTVSGTVKDADGYTVPGANVRIKGTKQGAITDLDGHYTLNNVLIDQTIQFTFVGMKPLEVVYKGQPTLNVTMESDAIALGEVVAIGYETKKKSVVTGAISSLSSDELMQAKPANAVSALNGRVSGVTVMPASGQPGSVPKLVIRGVGTNGNSNPLYVIDGLPMDDMNSVNPADIQSMEILKDATSTAIYGARGANGVVLITTRQGKKGKSSVTYDGYYGWSAAQSKTDMLNDKEYVELMHEFYANDGKDYPSSMPATTNGINTDWMDVVLETAPVTSHNVTATMGSDKGTTMLSLGYLDQNGIMGGDKSYFKRYTVRMNNVYDVNNYLKLGANVTYNYIDKQGVSSGSNGWNPLQYAYMMDPTTAPYDAVNGDANGFGISPVPFSRMWNPLSFMYIANNGKDKTKRFYGNAFAEITFIKDLIFKTDLGVNLYTRNQRSFAPKYEHKDSQSTKNTVNTSNNTSTFWQWENTLRYKKDFGKHHASILLGSTASRNKSEWFSASRNNYPDGTLNKKNYWYLNGGDVGTMANNGGASPTHSLYSLFGRLSYNYDEKYMAEVVVRRDGSSNFGAENQYATFPGVSLGWNVSNEDFWNVENFDVLKVRMSWGENGNEAISPFSYTSIIENDNYYTLGTNQTIYPGSAPASLVNPDVKWETSEQFNIGADMTFFGGKLRGSVDYFKKTTRDLLMRPTLEAIRGNEAPYQNVGEMENKGFEMQATYKDSYKGVNFSASFNASYLKNEVIKVGNTNGYIEGGLWRNVTRITRMEEGHAMGYFYGYKTNGIFQNEADVQNYTNKDGVVIQPDAVPGDFKWKDANGDGQITADDRVDLGNPWPKWTMGLTLTADYKGFDASIFLSSKLDYDLYAAQYRKEGYGRSNLPSFYKDRWTHEGVNNGVPRLSIDDPNGNFDKASDFYMYDASFLKIGNIEVGYTLPEYLVNKAKITKARVYVSMDNVATFTKYPFLDPEVGMMSSNNILDTGLDYSMYPQARTTRIGVSVTF